MENRNNGHVKWWWKHVWKFKSPPWYKITLWLALNNKLLTWDNGQKRGRCGPNRCTLCKDNPESVTHLFISCPYAGQVLAMISEKLKTQESWNKTSLEKCYRSWIQDRSVSFYAGLPSIMVSNIWWAWNNAVFNDKLVPPEVRASLTLSMAEEFKEDPRTQKVHCPIPRAIDYTIPWGYFDAASQGHPPNCVVGVVPFLSHSHYIHIRYTPGGGTNSRAELIALWTLLEAEKEKNVTKLQVFGYSKMAIDWANGKISMQNPNLATIMRDIKLNFRAFEQLTFHHILRELNTKADELSKEALELPNGPFSFYEFHEGIESESMEFQL